MEDGIEPAACLFSSSERHDAAGTRETQQTDEERSRNESMKKRVRKRSVREVKKWIDEEESEKEESERDPNDSEKSELKRKAD